MKCPPKVQKWLGITPCRRRAWRWACLSRWRRRWADGAMVRNIVLFGVLIYELVGPALTESLTGQETFSRRPKRLFRRRLRGRCRRWGFALKPTKT
ncbi:MAG: hypothetical protein ACLUI3_10230 [Christensenellales bacterium]